MDDGDVQTLALKTCDANKEPVRNNTWKQYPLLSIAVMEHKMHMQKLDEVGRGK
jgi:hypothetical protein